MSGVHKLTPHKLTIIFTGVRDCGLRVKQGSGFRKAFGCKLGFRVPGAATTKPSSPHPKKGSRFLPIHPNPKM